MKSALSTGTSTIVQDKRGSSKWVQTVRKETPPPNLLEYSRQWEAFFDEYAVRIDEWHGRNAGYHDAVAATAGFYIPAGASILEIGSGNGDFLAALRPARGVGIDISSRMVDLAAQKHPELYFRQMTAENLKLP